MEAYAEEQKTDVKTFRDLIDFLEDKLLNDEDREENRRWLGRNVPATTEAMIRRLYGISSEVSHLIRGATISSLSSLHSSAFRARISTTRYRTSTRTYRPTLCSNI
ncbi:hypothetical protein CAL7716_006390 [Calothrix sp. PCC 7716]|nr:hypothetical protein CAL7716_006390 [Calothrix sp. PCC 7716]